MYLWKHYSLQCKMKNMKSQAARKCTSSLPDQEEGKNSCSPAGCQQWKGASSNHNKNHTALSAVCKHRLYGVSYWFLKSTWVSQGRMNFYFWPGDDSVFNASLQNAALIEERPLLGRAGPGPLSSAWLVTAEPQVMLSTPCPRVRHFNSCTLQMLYLVSLVWLSDNFPGLEKTVQTTLGAWKWCSEFTALSCIVSVWGLPMLWQPCWEVIQRIKNQKLKALMLYVPHNWCNSSPGAQAALWGTVPCSALSDALDGLAAIAPWFCALWQWLIYGSLPCVFDIILSCVRSSLLCYWHLNCTAGAEGHCHQL